MDPVEPESAVLARFTLALERGDQSALRDLMRDDVWLTMPPERLWLAGRERLLRWLEALDLTDDLRLRATAANRQPAVVAYRRRPETGTYEADHIDVLRIENGRIAEITRFLPRLLDEFRLPVALTGAS